MGLTILPLEVANHSDPQRTETVEFPIDSCAVYSVVPRPTLQRLGIAPVAEHNVHRNSQAEVPGPPLRPALHSLPRDGRLSVS
jgi:hypothetical protein